MVRCLSCGCTKTSNLSFHMFPKNVEQRQAWLNFLGQNESSLMCSSGLCSYHFAPECFVDNLLQPDAIPTIKKDPSLCNKNSRQNIIRRIPVINTSDAVDPRTTSIGNTVQNYNTDSLNANCETTSATDYQNESPDANKLPTVLKPRFRIVEGRSKVKKVKRASNVTKRTIIQNKLSIAEAENCIMPVVFKPPQNSILLAPSKPNVEDHFFFALYEMCFSTDISIEKLDHPMFKKFITTFCNRTIEWEPSRRRDRIMSMRQACLIRLRSFLTNERRSLWLGLNQTYRGQKRFLNVTVGTLNSAMPSQSHLLLSKEIQEISIQEIIKQGIKNAGIEDYVSKNLMMVITDTSDEIIGIGAQMSKEYKVRHVKCFVHVLETIAECVLDEFEDVMDVVLHTPRLLNKHAKGRMYKPPQSLGSKLSSWISAACFYCDHFDVTKQLVQSFETTVPNVARVKKIWGDDNLKLRLETFKTYTKVIPVTVNMLENRKIGFQNAIVQFETALETLSMFSWSDDLQRHLKSVKDDEYFTVLRKIAMELDNTTESNMAVFKYAPVAISSLGSMRGVHTNCELWVSNCS